MWHLSKRLKLVAGALIPHLNDSLFVANMMDREEPAPVAHSRDIFCRT
jgi:hypothetical protein